MNEIKQQILFNKEECEFLKSYINSKELQKSGLNYGVVDDSIRNTKEYTSHSKELKEFVLNKLRDWGINSIEREILFLVYDKGSFFKKHKDTYDGFAVYRYKTLIVQLSNKNEYEGGTLTIEEVEFDKDLGNTILFDSKLEHEVSEIKSGQRISMVIWITLEDVMGKKTNKTLL